ncbi:syntaxin 18 [Fusarium sp. NRRL 52700]|nr:syntaxin 18 [Fusarium sp. NRRL 52700]
MNVTVTFNELLRERNAPETRNRVTLDAIDGFLKEAYRINSHITSLHRELQDVRQAYLSTAQPRKTHNRVAKEQTRVLTDRDREEVDANAKQMIRELNAGIRALDEAEQLRRETESAIIRKTYGGLGAFGAWASGGIISSKTEEHAEAEAKARDLGIHRDSILWYLRQRLELCCRTQQEMMETRLKRELEKNRSMLSRSGATIAGDFAEFPPSARRNSQTAPTAPIPMSEDGQFPSQGLTEEQIQMFEQGNQDMMKHFENSLDKVRTAEKSLLEIAELQSLLVNNLATQSAHIDQLVADSFATTENVGSGNKELKKATQRASPAKYTFFAASGLCAFLVLWDLVF